ncbi:MAG: hypothetical protein K6U80_18100 [Firmicutes bacterium]|nr:hypothetical protein [Bacillota bacterium]
MRGHWQSTFGGGLPFFWIPVLVLAALSIILILIYRRTKPKIAGLSESRQAVLDNFEAQILSLLVQHGGGMTQIEIRNCLDLPGDMVAEKLLESHWFGRIICRL